MEDDDIAPNTYAHLVQSQKVAPVYNCPVWCTGTTFCPYRLDQLYIFGATPWSSIFCPHLPLSIGAYVVTCPPRLARYFLKITACGGTGIYTTVPTNTIQVPITTQVQ